MSQAFNLTPRDMLKIASGLDAIAFDSRPVRRRDAEPEAAWGSFE